MQQNIQNLISLLNVALEHCPTQTNRLLTELMQAQINELQKVLPVDEKK